MRAEIAIMAIGFAFIGLMLGLAAFLQGGKPPGAMLIFAAGGAAIGAFLGLWGSVEADER